MCHNTSCDIIAPRFEAIAWSSFTLLWNVVMFVCGVGIVTWSECSSHRNNSRFPRFKIPSGPEGVIAFQPIPSAVMRMRPVSGSSRVKVVLLRAGMVRGSGSLRSEGSERWTVVRSSPAGTRRTTSSLSSGSAAARTVTSTRYDAAGSLAAG